MKQKKPTPHYSNLFIAIILIGLTSLLSFSLYKILHKRYAIEAEKAKFQNTISILEYKNSKLEKLKEYISTDDFKEKEAKKKLDYQKKGEVAIVVPSAKDMVAQLNDQNLKNLVNDTDGSFKPKAQTNPEKWWAYFFDKSRL